MANDATTNAKPQYGPDWVSSLVAIDPGTGAVKAMVSGQDFAVDQTNIATSPYGRQTGSTFKVITLAAALAERLLAAATPSTAPSPCPVPASLRPAQRCNDEPTAAGTRTSGHATAGSVNCAFVRLATSVGYDKVIAMAHDMGDHEGQPAPTSSTSPSAPGSRTPRPWRR